MIFKLVSTPFVGRISDEIRPKINSWAMLFEIYQLIVDPAYDRTYIRTMAIQTEDFATDIDALHKQFATFLNNSEDRNTQPSHSCVKPVELIVIAFGFECIRSGENRWVAAQHFHNFLLPGINRTASEIQTLTEMYSAIQNPPTTRELITMFRNILAHKCNWLDASIVIQTEPSFKGIFALWNVSELPAKRVAEFDVDGTLDQYHFSTDSDLWTELGRIAKYVVPEDLKHDFARMLVSKGQVPGDPDTTYTKRVSHNDKEVIIFIYCKLVYETTDKEYGRRVTAVYNFLFPVTPRISNNISHWISHSKSQGLKLLQATRPKEIPIVCTGIVLPSLEGLPPFLEDS